MPCGFHSDWLTEANATGVSMGDSLNGSGQVNAPAFLVVSAKDPIGANLDRLQVIKAWVDDAGNSHERIYDVAGSGNREADATTGLMNIPLPV